MFLSGRFRARVTLNSAPPRLERQLPEIGGAFFYSEVVKPATTLDQQTALLISRGLNVSDTDACQRFLYDTSYYRLSGYARQFQTAPKARDNTFLPGTGFDQVQRIVMLDTELSLALLRSLGAVERVVRARFAYELAHLHGPGGFYLDPASYLPVTPGIDRLLENINEELGRSKSPTVARYATGKDFTNVPVWVAFELVSFGTLSRVLEYLADRTARDVVAASFSEQKATFASTIHSLAVLRNRCAHHGQLWHRYLTIQTPVVRKEKRHTPSFDPQGPYPAVLAIRRLLRGVNSTRSGVDEIDRLLNTDMTFTQGLLTPAPR